MDECCKKAYEKGRQDAESKCPIHGAQEKAEFEREIRKDAIEQIKKPTAIGSCQVCGMDDAVTKEREQITNIMAKLKEKMEIAGYPAEATNDYRRGQFSVYEWLLRELR